LTPASANVVLRGALAFIGAVATSTGVLVALRGTTSIPGGAPTVASNDSVLRFYAVWWAAQGPAAWHLARDPGLDESQLRAVSATTFLGGLARIAAARASGRPHPLFQALTVAELLIPPILISLRRRAGDGRSAEPLRSILRPPENAIGSLSSRHPAGGMARSGDRVALKP